MSPRAITAALAVTLAALGAALLYLVLAVFYPYANYPSPHEVEIQRGMTFREAASELKRQGVVANGYVFSLIGKWGGLDRRLKAGHYELEGRLSAWDVYKILKEGRIIERPVMLVPGETIFDLRQKLLSLGLVNSASEFDRAATDPAFLSANNINAPSVEGYLLPETYSIPKGMPVGDVLTVMLRMMRERVTPEMLGRARAMGIGERELLTLASIVEKEARLPEEQPKVAAVYLNRLKKRMPLQADPTAIYGIKPLSAGVTAADLRLRTRYNTYQFAGLPPGPIAAPGLGAINAVLSPAEGGWLYFVADGRTGGHIFSETLRQHERAVARYREEMKRQHASEKKKDE